MVHSEVEVPISPLSDNNSTEALNETIEGSLRTEKLKLKFAPFSMELPPVLKKAEVEAIATRLVDFTKLEKERQKLAEAGFVYYLREKLDEETFRTVTTESERTELASVLQTEGSWLESEHFLTAVSENLLKRKDAIRSTVSDALDREEEMGKRPAAVEDMEKKLDKLTETATSLNVTMPWVPSAMLEEVFTSLKEAREWLLTKLQEQQTRQPWENPAFRVAELPWKLESVKILLDAVKQVPKPKSTHKKGKKPKPGTQSAKTSEDQSKENYVPEPVEELEDPLELPTYVDL